VVGFFDTLLVIISFCLSVIIKPGFGFHQVDMFYLLSLLVFLFLWIIVSHFTRKFRLGSDSSLREILTSVFIANFIILSITSILLILLHHNQFSRFIIFGTIGMATGFEVVMGWIYYGVIQSEFLTEWIGPEIINGNSHNGHIHNNNQPATVTDIPAPIRESMVDKSYPAIYKAIETETGKEAAAWISIQVDITASTSLLLSTTTRFNIDNQPDNTFSTIINLHLINDIQRVNKFFESLNLKLPTGGIFIGCAETYLLRKKRILAKYPPILNYIIYTIDFFINRVSPKMKITRKFYFLFSRGKNRVISRTETLGRVHSCGFEVLEEKTIGNLLFWKARKISTPAFDYHPTYGILIRLKRVGKHGKVFNVYKFRTMHAYSEYVQAYIHKQNNLDDSGKFRDDYRVSTLGRLLRKYWLDELPMLINVVKGDMKIVGVRPLSLHFFDLYSPELREIRTQFKPGLIPPYYAQFPTPGSLDEVQENEKKYLLEYAQHPFRTDINYFFLAMKNIIVKKARSH